MIISKAPASCTKNIEMSVYIAPGIFNERYTSILRDMNKLIIDCSIRVERCRFQLVLNTVLFPLTLLKALCYQARSGETRYIKQTTDSCVEFFQTADSCILICMDLMDIYFSSRCYNFSVRCYDFSGRCYHFSDYSLLFFSQLL